ncbi:37S ribosomal protein rsm22 [Biscogniauxia marginata]|nr:37S ribosomal protein rsm22 [Biscogniauxia marginata]
MSVEIWPPIAPDQLKIEEDATQARELSWLLASLRTTLKALKRGLEDSYALLAPIDPGSTLVLSTPRAEAVKGTVTRVGTRIVKGTVHLRLRTLPPQTLSLDPARPIHLAPLAALNTLLTEAIDLVGFCVSEDEGGPATSTSASASAAFLSSQLRLLAQHLAEASALIKGSSSNNPPLTVSPPDEVTRDPTASHRTANNHSPHNHPLVIGAAWTTSSVPLAHFAPPMSRNLSFYLTIQDASLVLYLRALEPAGAPMNFGAKLAFAIGTARRLEHDEADLIFGYRCGYGGDDDDDDDNVADMAHLGPGFGSGSGSGSSSRRRPVSAGSGGSNNTSGGSSSSVGGNTAMSSGNGNVKGVGQGREVEVYVREKVRVESADPSLLSLSAKLSALANTLSLARTNLAAVMGEEEFED